jgi:hypothetical protein
VGGVSGGFGNGGEEAFDARWSFSSAMLTRDVDNTSLRPFHTSRSKTIHMITSVPLYTNHLS